MIMNSGDLRLYSLHCVRKASLFFGGREMEWMGCKRDSVASWRPDCGDLKAPCVERVWMRCFLTSSSHAFHTAPFVLYDSTIYTGGGRWFINHWVLWKMFVISFFFFINISLRFRIRHLLPPSFPALPSFLPMFKSDRLPRLFLGIIKMQSTFR